MFKGQGQTIGHGCFISNLADWLEVIVSLIAFKSHNKVQGHPFNNSLSSEIITLLLHSNYGNQIRLSQLTNLFLLLTTSSKIPCLYEIIFNIAPGGINVCQHF